MADISGLTAALADRYVIEREIGTGGMATVSLAEDLKHHRTVAIKVLRDDISASVGAARFLREIQIAAALQHPNIVPVLDSGDAGGRLCYVMPFVEATTLRQRIARGGELPVGEAGRLLIEVADAFAYAHAHGVVHRDVKPDNIMRSGRYAMVADFGVAPYFGDDFQMSNLSENFFS